MDGIATGGAATDGTIEREAAADGATIRFTDEPAFRPREDTSSIGGDDRG